MMELAPDALRGSYPPLVTPLRDGEVDYDVYAHLVEMQIRGGSDGVVVNGTTGEPTTLTLRERMRLVDTAVKAAAGRVAVVAATGSQSLAETLELTAAAEEAGAQAALVLTPYFLKPPPRGMVDYYVEIGRRTRLPVLIYHIPGRAAVEMKPETIERIADRLPNLVGLMHAVGNVAPRRVADLYRAAARGDAATARRLHEDLFELNQAVFFDTNPIPIKYMMKRMGLLPNEEHRLPMVPATAELAERLDGVLRRAGLLPAGTADRGPDPTSSSQ